MENIRVVTLEILRHGPAHNQLLSPLTNYLALCGNHPAVSLQIPFEHEQLKMRLRAMSYMDSETTRQMQRDDMAGILGGLLGQIPGLLADSVKQGGSAPPLTHLRLILSASELALLPFELSRAPNGFPGAGQPLLLQSEFPMCLTREVRRVSNRPLKWPDRPPRILLIAAQPPGVGSIPLESHLSVLRTAIDPWLWDYAPGDSNYLKAIEKNLVILPRADVDQISRACAENQFTHVHILAHGVKYVQGESNRFGLALHHPRDTSKQDVVDGDRLANLLRGDQCNSFDRGPAVVTLASCDSGNAGTVESIGASVAHALHGAGIPLVVASQFPLSFPGSVLMTQVLYDELLWGSDPRRLLCELRRQLQARVPETHDWASLVVYTSLPEEYSDQFESTQRQMARHAINAAMDRADNAIDTGGDLTDARKRIHSATDRLSKLKPTRLDEIVEVAGLLASTAKREAQIVYRDWINKKRQPSTAEAEILRFLHGAKRNYFVAAYQKEPDDPRDLKKSSIPASSWAVVQYIVLTAVLDGLAQIDPDMWQTAKYTAMQDLDNPDRQTATWAHGSMMELYLLGSKMDQLRKEISESDCEQAAVYHVEHLQKLGVKNEIYTTSRQLKRYGDFFKDVAHDKDLAWPSDLAKTLEGYLKNVKEYAQD